MMSETTLRPEAGAGLADVARAIPNFFIVGAAKCGTTSLFAALAKHPDVFCCPVKEPNYFAFDLTSQTETVTKARREGAIIEGATARFIEPPRVGMTLDYEVYLDLFRSWRGERAIGEASTSYLTSGIAARELARLVPQARIIIVLRDPIPRIYSDYLMQVQTGRRVGSFREVIMGAPETVIGSLYAPNIRRYLAHFPREQLLFLLFEELIAEPQRTLATVFRHIGVDPGAADDVELGWENKSRQPRFAGLNRMFFGTGLKSTVLRAVPRPIRHRLRPLYYSRHEPPPLSAEDRGLLLTLLGDDIAETATLIRRDLSHWRQGG